MKMIARAACFAAMSLLAFNAAGAQERSANRDGFTLMPGKAKIVLFRPTITVGEQSTGGLAEPNADWTQQARTNIGAALAATQGALGNEVVAYEEPLGTEAGLAAEYRSLFTSVADAVIVYKLFPGNRLPTKKRAGVFDWTLGPGLQALPGMADADYALFIFTEDQYGSAGRKVAQLLFAMAGGAMTSGVHRGYAGLIDVKTGNLVWFNADPMMGGDVRTNDGAQRRVAQLLQGFPGRPAVNGPTK